MRLALWGFKLGAPLTRVCDSDVQASWFAWRWSLVAGWRRGWQPVALPGLFFSALQLPTCPPSSPTLDQQAVCPATSQKQGSMFMLGSVGRCLSKAVAEGKPLAEGCRKLVLVAAPSDARSIVTRSSASVEAVAARVAEVGSGVVPGLVGPGLAVGVDGTGGGPTHIAGTDGWFLCARRVSGSACSARHVDTPTNLWACLLILTSRRLPRRRG